MPDSTNIETRIRQLESDLAIGLYNLEQVVEWIKNHIRHTETLASKTEADRRFIRDVYDA